MKISAQDEYGLRILIRIARSKIEEGLSIPQISEAEGMSASYVAKLTRTLRLAGFIQSTPGQKGGYVLSRPPEEIRISEVLRTLGGALYDEDFCDSHSGAFRICTNSVDCSVRSLWKVIQYAVDHVLGQVTLRDLLGSEQNANVALENIILYLNQAQAAVAEG